MTSRVTDKLWLATGIIIIGLFPRTGIASELDIQLGEVRTILQEMSPHRLPGAVRHFSIRGQARRVDLHQVILEASRVSDIEPAVLAVLIKIESGFDPDASSSMGAMGLTQLMPTTLDKLGISNAREPESNVMGGARWLAKLLREHNGNLLAALAAYNAGSGVMRRPWRRWPRETRNYLERFVRIYPQFSKDWKKHTPRYIYFRP